MHDDDDQQTASDPNVSPGATETLEAVVKPSPRPRSLLPAGHGFRTESLLYRASGGLSGNAADESGCLLMVPESSLSAVRLVV